MPDGCPLVPAVARPRVPTLWFTWFCLLLAILPLGYLAIEIATWVRNIPNWDEFDTVLDFLIALDAGAPAKDILTRLFAVNNEHRTVVSRVIFAVAYWTSGGINFIALAVIGNLFLAGTFVVLLRQVDDNPARLRLAAVFALVVFQLQHHESLFWAGSSIDHFLVVLLAALALATVTARRVTLLPGCIFATLATFSLAHGLVVWPVGAALLWFDRRRRECLIWSAAALAASALYFAGFHVNPGHRLPGLAEIQTILVYWLTLVGTSPALDHVNIAPWFGGALVATTVILWRRGIPERERLPAAMIAWCLGAMAMIAWGRALLSHEWTPVTSRYVILSSVPAALLVWVVLERILAPRAQAAWWWATAMLGLAAFNVAANAAHESAGRVFAQHGEKAIHDFRRHGTFSKVNTPLYPDPIRADIVIREVEQRNIFRLPQTDDLELSKPAELELTQPQEIADAVYFIDDVVQGPNELRVRGWAFRPEHTTRLAEIAVVFRSNRTLIAFEATPQMRPDVAEAHERWDATYAGFDLTLPYDELPAGVYGVGICFVAETPAEYIMTASNVVIPARTLAQKE